MPAVSLSIFGGVGAQFFDNNGNPLTGGKIYTYSAGTTTPLATYTTNSDASFHTNPIVLDAAGRVPSGGEIWLQLGVGYKFAVKTSNDVPIATYDNIPSSAQPPAANDADSIMYEQGYTVTAGSFVAGKIYRIVSVGTTDFTLIGAVNNTVGTHFIATGVGSGTGTAELSQTVETKLRQTVSVKDFGAVGDGVTDDTAAIQAMIDAYLQYYAAYPKMDNYSQGTLIYPNLGRVTFYFPPGKYIISDSIDLTYRGFFTIMGYGAVIQAKLNASVNKPMFNYLLSNECSTHGLTFEAADAGGINRFLFAAQAGGSDNFIPGGYPSAKSVHFIDCEFRNPGDTCLNMTNNTGTYVAGVDAPYIENCFFAGGAVGIKYAGYEAVIVNPYISSQTYAGLLLYSADKFSVLGGTWYMNNVCPAVLIDTDQTVYSARFFGSYMETMTYAVQALGSGTQECNLYFDGGNIEGCVSGILELVNRLAQVTFKNVKFGVSSNNRNLSCANVNSTLVLDQNQIQQDNNGAMGNTQPWAGNVTRTGYLAGRPVDNGSTANFDVYVDPVGGSDQNEGYTSGRALATLTEALRRVNSRGQTTIRLLAGTHIVPANFNIYSGHVYIVTLAGAILNCTNPISVYNATLTLQNVTFSQERSVCVYGGVVYLRACTINVSSANGHIFVQNGYVSATVCTFAGSSGVAFYVGSQFEGVQGILYGDGSNTWGGGITKYQAYAGITTLIQSAL